VASIQLGIGEQVAFTTAADFTGSVGGYSAQQTGIANSDVGTLSAWLYVDSTATPNIATVFTGYNDVSDINQYRFALFMRMATKVVEVEGYNEETESVVFYSSTAKLAEDAWNHIIISWDTSTGGGIGEGDIEMYINDVLDTPDSFQSGSTQGNENHVYYASSFWTLGALGDFTDTGSPTFSNFYPNRVSQLWFDPSTDIDLSVAANRRLFTCVGTSAQLATGTADSGSSSTMVDADRTESASNHWSGNRIRFTSGDINGEERLIIKFASDTDTITFSPNTSAAVSAGITYEIISAPQAHEPLGDTGEIPTGTAPAFYFPGDGEDFVTNAGTQGNLSTALSGGFPASAQGPVLCAVSVDASITTDVLTITVTNPTNQTVTDVAITVTVPTEVDLIDAITNDLDATIVDNVITGGTIDPNTTEIIEFFLEIDPGIHPVIVTPVTPTPPGPPVILEITVTETPTVTPEVITPQTVEPRKGQFLAPLSVPTRGLEKNVAFIGPGRLRR
jgi:hypothetical protein